VLECSLGRKSHPNKIKDFEKQSSIYRRRFLALAKLELWSFLIIMSGGGESILSVVGESE